LDLDAVWGGSAVSRGMGVLDAMGWKSSKGMGRFGVNVGHPIVTNEDFIA